MKKLLTLLFLIAAIGVNAQTVQITSKALGDLILINRGANELSPIPTGSNTDTIRSYDYRIYPGRDTLGTMTIQINYYNKSATLLQTDYLTVSQTLYPKWKVLITAIDNYIINRRKRLVKP